MGFEISLQPAQHCTHPLHALQPGRLLLRRSHGRGGRGSGLRGRAAGATAPPRRRRGAPTRTRTPGGPSCSPRRCLCPSPPRSPALHIRYPHRACSGLWWPGGSCLRRWPGSQCHHPSRFSMVMCVPCAEWCTGCAQGHAQWGSKGLHRLHSTSGVENGHAGNGRQPAVEARNHRRQPRNCSPPQQPPGAALQCLLVAARCVMGGLSSLVQLLLLSFACNVLQCMLRPRTSSASRSLTRPPSATYRHRPGLSTRAWRPAARYRMLR